MERSSKAKNPKKLTLLKNYFDILDEGYRCAEHHPPPGGDRGPPPGAGHPAELHTTQCKRDRAKERLTTEQEKVKMTSAFVLSLELAPPPPTCSTLHDSY
jgi:hypothetical protein